MSKKYIYIYVYNHVDDDQESDMNVLVWFKDLSSVSHVDAGMVDGGGSTSVGE